VNPCGASGDEAEKGGNERETLNRVHTRGAGSALKGALTAGLIAI